MVKLILEITEENGIGVELKSEDVAPSPQEKLFARQMAETITKFLNNAPKQANGAVALERGGMVRDAEASFQDRKALVMLGLDMRVGNFGIVFLDSQREDPTERKRNSQEIFWCKIHHREATFVSSDLSRKCDPHLSGIMIPCQVVKAFRITPDWTALLEDFVRECRDNFDCDEDAHKHHTFCRACEAAKLLPK